VLQTLKSKKNEHILSIKDFRILGIRALVCSTRPTLRGWLFSFEQLFFDSSLAEPFVCLMFYFSQKVMQKNYNKNSCWNVKRQPPLAPGP
jgi:hypothetical protein